MDRYGVVKLTRHASRQSSPKDGRGVRSSRPERMLCTRRQLAIAGKLQRIGRGCVSNRLGGGYECRASGAAIEQECWCGDAVVAERTIESRKMMRDRTRVMRIPYDAACRWRDGGANNEGDGEQATQVNADRGVERGAWSVQSMLIEIDTQCAHKKRESRKTAGSSHSQSGAQLPSRIQAKEREG